MFRVIFVLLPYLKHDPRFTTSHQHLLCGLFLVLSIRGHKLSPVSLVQNKTPTLRVISLGPNSFLQSFRSISYIVFPLSNPRPVGTPFVTSSSPSSTTTGFTTTHGPPLLLIQLVRSVQERKEPNLELRVHW